MTNLDNPMFHDAELAREYLEAQRWPNGPYCPHCGNSDPEKITSLKGKAHRPGLYQCNEPECRLQFSVTVGTVFERSKIPLNKWLLATFLMTSSKKGMSAHQFGRMLGLTYKSAWFLGHRIREAMNDKNPGPLGGEGKTVEADETYFGNGTRRARRKDGRKAGPDKWKVLSLVERDGKSRSTHVDFITANRVREVLVTNVDRKSDLMTDESNVYTNVGSEFTSHKTVNHGQKEYVRGIVTTNTVEGFFSIFKRGMKGIYQHCGEQHLQRYLNEFDFRYSYRVKLGYSDTDRANLALKGIEGKRLMYFRPAKA